MTALTPPHHRADANREEIAQVAALAAGGLLRGAEVAMVVLIGLLVCPPLAILVVVVGAPLLAAAIVAGLVAAIVAIQYLLVRRLREHHRTHRTPVPVPALRRLRASEA